MYFVIPKYSCAWHDVRRFLYIQNAHGSLRIIVVACPIQNPLALEIKNVERQFSEFLTDRASKCVISQFEWPLSTSYRVSYCVFFSREQQRSAAAAVN